MMVSKRKVKSRDEEDNILTINASVWKRKEGSEADGKVGVWWPGAAGLI